jgi:uncharacterized membrane protein
MNRTPRSLSPRQKALVLVLVVVLLCAIAFFISIGNAWA